MDDKDRSQWVDNDEGLYRAWQAAKVSKKQWIAQNRAFIDDVIANVLSGRQPAHYLRYGPRT